MSTASLPPGARRRGAAVLALRQRANVLAATPPPMMALVPSAPAPPAKRRGITSQSRKAKGRNLQQLVAARFRQEFQGLRGNDIRSTSMGAAGDDLILSPEALDRLPYNFEMKWHETLNLWSTLQQVMKRHRKVNAVDDGSVETLPAMVVKHNRALPLAILPLGHWCNLLRLQQDAPSDRVHREACVLPLVTVTQALADFQRGPSADAARDLQTATAALLMFALRAPHGVGALPAGAPGVRVQAPGAAWDVHTHAGSTLNLWTTWAKLTGANAAPRHRPALVFNRGNPDAPAFVVMPFDDFVVLTKARWRHVRQEKMRRLRQELASETLPTAVAP